MIENKYSKFPISETRQGNNDQNHIHYLENCIIEDSFKIISSAAFRRMQDKTQLFPLEKHDYVRTRLTHSLEVASTGKYLAQRFLQKILFDNKTGSIAFYSQDIAFCEAVYVAGLIHDIGNPPFGHYGENIIRNYFSSSKFLEKMIRFGDTTQVHIRELVGEKKLLDDFKHFDGNAQGLRVVTKLEHGEFSSNGLDLCACCISGMIKYPWSSAVGGEKQKFGYFSTEKSAIDFLKEERCFYEKLRNPISVFMEIADDICMRISDIEDSIKKGCIHADSFENSIKDNKKLHDEFLKYYDRNKTQVNSLLCSVSQFFASEKEKWIEEIIDLLCDENGSLGKNVLNKLFEGKISGHDIMSRIPSAPLIDKLHNLIIEKVYCHKQIVIPELQGHCVLEYLLDEFVSAVLDIDISSRRDQNVKEKNGKILCLLSASFLYSYLRDNKQIPKKKVLNEEYMREDLICRLHLAVDQVCGMTDSYAKEIYSKLKGIN